jgi:hypothetical protein
LPSAAFWAAWLASCCQGSLTACLEENEMPSSRDNPKEPIDTDAEERARNDETGAERSTGIPETAGEGTQTSSGMAASEGVQSGG